MILDHSLFHYVIIIKKNDAERSIMIVIFARISSKDKFCKLDLNTQHQMLWILQKYGLCIKRLQLLQRLNKLQDCFKTSNRQEYFWLYKIDSTVQESRWFYLQEASEDILSTKATIWSYSQTSLEDVLNWVHFTVNLGWLNNIRLTWF